MKGGKKMKKGDIEEKIEKLESDMKRINKKVFPKKEAEIRGDPVVKLK